MKVLLFGGSGMIGQGVLRECLQRPEVTKIISVGRTPLEQKHEKLEELLRKDLFDWSDAGLAERQTSQDRSEAEAWAKAARPETRSDAGLAERQTSQDRSEAEAQLTGIDAVFFCLGVSSSGMSEADYTKVTYELPMSVARVLKKTSPGLTFCLISGAGTDAKSSSMWARVKARTENELQQVGFKAVYCFRPGYIQPMDGIVSKTRSYRLMYTFTKPLYPLFKGFKSTVTTTRQLGFAMVQVALNGHPKTILESADINAVG